MQASTFGQTTYTGCDGTTRADTLVPVCTDPAAHIGAAEARLSKADFFQSLSGWSGEHSTKRLGNPIQISAVLGLLSQAYCENSRSL
mmetsp:Transcript_32297/g.77164  ORF Transcript_32297/g.77164 Transcript_32297/m.77164 type:complete len:87 (-) Transcript_32297:1583-1843(-)